MKICFWGDIAGALKGKTNGGGQIQIALLAKALAASGNEVVVLDNEARQAFVTDDGVCVLPIPGWHRGVRMIRTFTHKLPGLYSALKEQHADIYYCRIRNYRHAFSYWAARKVNAKFILGLASDLDIMDFRSRWKYLYTKNSKELWSIFDGLVTEFVYPFLLRKSDQIFVQHIGQRDLLLGKERESLLFPNLIDPEEIPGSLPLAGEEFVYVGRLDRRKGFHEFYQLVKSAPGHSFKVIGPPRHKQGHIMYEKFKLLPNVRLLGELSHRETLKEIANSVALISTSPMEGFPNIFLEAWACGVPVLSLYVDPGDVISKENLGIIAHGNLDLLLNGLDSFKESGRDKERLKAYVMKNHVLTKEKINEIDILFNKIAVKGYA
jgi:glycosyltransferase involved in cell wall biosynthesis